MSNGNYLITMPDVGEGIAEVEIADWPVKVGDRVEEDDLICVVMTDKATVEIPSPVDGVITWIGCEAGDTMAVGAEFIRLEVEGEGNISATQEVSQPEPKAAEPVAAVVVENKPVREAYKKPVAAQSATATSTARKGSPPRSAGISRAEGDKPIAAPAVRQRARNAGIDLNFVRGTGPAGRITHEDLDAFITGSSAPVAVASGQGAQPNMSVTEVPVRGLRRKIAAIMQDTMQRIPHFTYVEEVDVTELEKLRQKLNKERRDDQPKLTMLPFFVKALVKAMQEYPEMGSHFDDANEMVYQIAAAHIGIATQTSNGLVVPVVRHAETMSVWESANEIKRLSSTARDGKATREELSGSNITITSLGPMGGIVTTPVINSPEVAILGINKVAKRPVWQDGGFVPRDIMNLSSSFDHRIIDGWEATLFIQHIKSLLESPATLFMEK
jgi:2-oxoisovalerate dehydrogenase E2 component (dihydrolipoyl transacylase)